MVQISRLSRRQFMAGATALAGAGVTGLRPAFSADAQIEISSIWGADKPFQKVVDAFNDKKTGVTVVNRFDGTMRPPPPRRSPASPRAVRRR